MGADMDNCIDHPDYKKFLKIHKKLKDSNSLTKKGFKASREIKKLGYPIIYGFFKQPRGDWDYIHFWNLDKEKNLYIDICASQFDNHSEKVLITPINENHNYKRKISYNLIGKIFNIF